MNGATTRQPASTSRGVTFRHPHAVSGKPCRHNAIGASGGPQVNARSWTDGVAMSIQSGSLMSACYTGSNFEISQRSPTLFSVMRTLDAVSVGTPLPTVTVWLTNNRTTALPGSADTDAAAGTLATAEICFSLAPGITTLFVRSVYWSRNWPMSRSRAAVNCCSTVSGLYESNATVLSLAACIDVSRAASLSRTPEARNLSPPAPIASTNAGAGNKANSTTRDQSGSGLGSAKLAAAASSSSVMVTSDASCLPRVSGGSASVAVSVSTVSAPASSRAAASSTVSSLTSLFSVTIRTSRWPPWLRRRPSAR